MLAALKIRAARPSSESKIIAQQMMTAHEKNTVSESSTVRAS